MQIMLMNINEVDGKPKYSSHRPKKNEIQGVRLIRVRCDNSSM